MMPEVAVAVVSWNTRELLRRCLRSMEADAASGLAEIWVVDNASSDGSQEMVAAEFPWVTLIASEENLGFGRGVNRVAAEAGGASWVAAANADIVLEEGALRRMIEAAGPGTGVVAPRLITPGGATQHSVHSFPGLWLGVATNLGLYRLPGVGDKMLIEGFWKPERARTVPWAHGAFLLVRREAFDGVGGFDDEQWMYAEDIDLLWRLQRAGWTTRYEPGARVRHEVSAATVAAFGSERTARHIGAAYAWLARRRGVVVAWAYAALNVSGAAVRWLALAVAARVRSERFTAERDRVRRLVSIHARGLRRRKTLLRAIEPPADFG